MTHPIYLDNVKINFVNSGRVNQKLLDFYIDVYSGTVRNTKMLINAYAVSTGSLSNFDVGFSNFFEYAATEHLTSSIPSFLRIKGYPTGTEENKIALFFTKFIQPFAKEGSNDTEEIECSTMLANVSCFYYDDN